MTDAPWRRLPECGVLDSLRLWGSHKQVGGDQRATLLPGVTLLAFFIGATGAFAAALPTVGGFTAAAARVGTYFAITVGSSEAISVSGRRYQVSSLPSSA